MALPIELVAFASVTISILIILLLLLELKLARAIGSVGEELQSNENGLSNYRGYRNYLRGSERATGLEKVDSLFRSLRFLEKYRLFLRMRQRALVEAYGKRADDQKLFLEHFVHEYSTREIERSKDFFQSRSFDKDQLQAIVKRETYNLVIASAGSGKTSTLTARVAYAVRTGATQREILALAYTKSAEGEMRHRLKDEYGIVDANVRTFHSLAREIAKLSPNFRIGVAGNKQQPGIIRTARDRLRSDRHFAKLMLGFAVELQAIDVEEEEFASREKYYEFLRYQRHTTLGSKPVKSVAERDIANFLFLNRVKFEYEAPAAWADRNPKYRMYQPDFFLPEYDIWIEHWAIDRRGKVPAWFSTVQQVDPSLKYQKGMQWKRYQFQKHGRKLIETYNHQWAEGALIPELARQLEENHVQLRELTTDEILDKVQELIPRRDVLNELMFSFISKAKTNGLTIGDVTTRLRQGNWTRKQRIFASLMIRVWQEYESILKENDMIDFNDMINYALQVAKSSNTQLVRKYSQILIDEYQDITNPQLELIQSLLSTNAGSTLFCVGDDGQNIFSFAGSNIYNILGFENRFPYAEKTILRTNYRCPKNIVEVSNFVANQNKCKVKKNVIPASKIQQPIRLIQKPGSDETSYDDWQHERAKQLVMDLIQRKKPSEEIMVLSRFNYPLKRLELEFPQNEMLGLRFLSIHRAKGMEAEYVLILSCISGKNGFPSQLLDKRILDIVQNTREDGSSKLEEERRLYYVALTRCKNQLYLFTSSTQRSIFISETQSYLSPITGPERVPVPA